MRLISVVMGVDTTDNRTSDTVKLLNYGFNSYKLEIIFEKDKVIDNIRVEKGKSDNVDIVLLNDATELLNVSDTKKNYTIKLSTYNVVAPIKKGDVIGDANIYDSEGNLIKTIPITVKEDILKANLWDYFKRNISTLVIGKNII